MYFKEFPEFLYDFRYGPYETKTSIIYNVMLPNNDGEAKISVPKPISKLYGTSAMICEKYNHQIDDFLKTIK